MNFYNKMRETSDEPNSKLFKNLSDEISLNQQENDFYSSIHEERIKNAPKIVQDYYNGDGIKFEKGLFRVLVAKKSNRIIFFMMIFMIAIVFITNNISSSNNIVVVNGYECELQSFSYDDTVYASVKVHPVKKTREKINKFKNKKMDSFENFSSLELPVKIIFYGISESDIQMKFPEEINSKIFDNTIIYRTETQDYNVVKVIAQINIGEQTNEAVVNVLRKEQ